MAQASLSTGFRAHLLLVLYRDIPLILNMIAAGRASYILA